MENKHTQFSRAARNYAVLGCLAMATAASAATDSVPEGYVSRNEYEALKQQVVEMQKALRALKADKPVATTSASESKSGSTASAVQALSQEVTDLRSVVEETKPGTTKFHIAGSASASFIAPQHGPANFSATFAPVFLWQLSDKLMFEGETEMELAEDGTTLVNLEYAHLSYALNDYMTIGAGKFLSPMNIFVERYEPNWINKLPDTPLAIYDGILPETNLGLQIRGAVPVGPVRFNYALFASNTPRVLSGSAEEAGQLQFDNFSSLNNAKEVGGRIGFLPFPWLELGYGMQTGHVTDVNATGNPRSTQQSVDMEIHHNSDLLKGNLTLLAQYAWSDTGKLTYDPNAADFGPLTYSNHRNGGYVQASYRPRELSDTLNRMEFIVRADEANMPNNEPGGFDEKRLTFGIDYWVTSSAVLKAAYEIDRRNHNEPNQNAVLLQFAVGL